MRKWINNIMLFFKKGDKKENSAITTKVLKIVENIPEYRWAVGRVKQKFTGECCVLGHIAEAEGIIPLDTDQVLEDCKLAREINDKVIRFMKLKHDRFAQIYHINDRDQYNGYVEKHPKERITHLLNDMIKEGY